MEKSRGMKTMNLWCVECQHVTMHKRIGKPNYGRSRYKCMLCGNERSRVTPS